MNFTFLFCTERSGSNLITSLMNGHSKVCGPPPSHLFRLFGRNREGYDSHDAEASLLEDFCAAHETMLGDWNTTLTRGELEQRGAAMTVAEMLQFMYEKECRHDLAEQVFVKENYTYEITDFLVENWPHARYVHLVRDPRDVAASWVNTAAVPGGTEKAVSTWLRDQTRTLHAIEHFLGAESVLFLQYEQLISDPDQAAAHLCQHLALEFEPQMLSFHKDPRTQRNAERIGAWSNLQRPVMRTNSGKYKSVLSPEDRRYVEVLCGDLMAAFGYDRDFDDLPSPGDAVSVEQLRSGLTPGQEAAAPSHQEDLIRRRRRALIERITSRSKEPQ